MAPLTKIAQSRLISNPDDIICTVVLQVIVDRTIVLAHVLRIPTITSDDAIREGSVLALESGVAATHDGLAEVFEAVRKVTLHLLLDFVARDQTAVDLDNVIETV